MNAGPQPDQEDDNILPNWLAFDEDFQLLLLTGGAVLAGSVYLLYGAPALLAGFGTVAAIGYAVNPKWMEELYYEARFTILFGIAGFFFSASYPLIGLVLGGLLGFSIQQIYRQVTQAVHDATQVVGQVFHPFNFATQKIKYLLGWNAQPAPAQGRALVAHQERGLYHRLRRLLRPTAVQRAAARQAEAPQMALVPANNQPNLLQRFNPLKLVVAIPQFLGNLGQMPAPQHPEIPQAQKEPNNMPLVAVAHPSKSLWERFKGALAEFTTLPEGEHDALLDVFDAGSMEGLAMRLAAPPAAKHSVPEVAEPVIFSQQKADNPPLPEQIPAVVPEVQPQQADLAQADDEESSQEEPETWGAWWRRMTRNMPTTIM